MRRLFPPNSNDRRLNIGAGRWYRPRWENIDLYVDEFYADYRIDLREKKPLPLPTECASMIFASHVLEHVSDDVCIFILKECRRLLKPGGTVRVVVPDMDKAFEAYNSNNIDFFLKGCPSCSADTTEGAIVNFFASYRKGCYSGGPVVEPDVVRNKIEQLDRYEFVKWCVEQIPDDAPYKAHVNGYDFPKLRLLFEQAGFEKVERSSYRKSAVGALRHRAFDNYPIISLYVEAYKQARRPSLSE